MSAITAFLSQGLGTVLIAGDPWPSPKAPHPDQPPTQTNRCLGVEMSRAYLELMDQLGGLFGRLKFLG